MNLTITTYLHKQATKPECRVILVSLLLHILEVPGWNLDTKTGIPDKISLSLHKNKWNQAISASARRSELNIHVFIAGIFE